MIDPGTSDGEQRPPPQDDRGFLGHPRGLPTLSGLEVWERFSFPGMRAILVLHFADTVARGGMGMAPGTAASVSAAYFGVNGAVAVAVGPAVTALVPWLRRTMHPVRRSRSLKPFTAARPPR